MARKMMSILQDAEASFSKFHRNQIMGLVWFNSFNSWSPEGRGWSSLPVCAWHFLRVKCPLVINLIKPVRVQKQQLKAKTECSFIEWHISHWGGTWVYLDEGRDDPKCVCRIIRKNPELIPGLLPEDTGEIRQNALNKCGVLEIQFPIKQEVLCAWNTMRGF